MSWFYNMSGDFMTCSEKVGAFRIWNASQKTPKSIIKVGATGIRSFESFKDDPNMFVAVFKDGSLGLFNLKKKKVVWTIEAGHSETIFDIKFKNADASILATGSYDGYIKIWNTNTMKLLATLSQQVKRKPGEKTDNGQIVYCISWAPGDDVRLISSHANGDIVVWDYTKNKLLFKFRPGSEGPIFRVDWNLNNKEYITCGSTEGNWYF